MNRPILVRITRLHEEMEARRFPNCRTVARVLETSPKTIQRDLDFMRDQLGLPIAYDPKRYGFYYESEGAGLLPFPWLKLFADAREASRLVLGN